MSIKLKPSTSSSDQFYNLDDRSLSNGAKEGSKAGPSAKEVRSKLTSFGKNILKSTKNLAFDVADSYVPNGKEVKDSFAETFSSAKEDFDKEFGPMIQKAKQFIHGAGKEGSESLKSKITKEAKEIKDRLKSGKFYTSMDDEIEASFGLDDDFNFDDSDFGDFGDDNGTYTEVTEPDSLSEEPFGGVKKGKTRRVNVSRKQKQLKQRSTPMKKPVRKSSGGGGAAAQLRLGDELVSNTTGLVGQNVIAKQEEIWARTNDAQEKRFSKLYGYQNQILKGINSLVEYNNNIDSQNVRAQMEFQGKLLAAQQDSLNQLKELKDAMIVLSTYKTDKPKETLNSKIGNSSIGLNGKAYWENIKKNLGEVAAGNPLLSIFTMAPMMGDMMSMGEDTGVKMINPLNIASKSLLTAFLSKGTKMRLRNFNDLLSNFGGLFTGKMNEMARFGNNDIVRTIGRIFGSRETTVKQIDNGLKDVNAVVGWTSKSDRTLNEVIPTLLSKQLAAMSGGNELKYDYKSGRFITDKSAREEYDLRMTQAWNSAETTTYNNAITGFINNDKNKNKEYNKTLKAIDPNKLQKAIETITQNISKSGMQFNPGLFYREDYVNQLTAGIDKTYSGTALEAFTDAYNNMSSEERIRFLGATQHVFQNAQQTINTINEEFKNRGLGQSAVEAGKRTELEERKRSLQTDNRYQYVKTGKISKSKVDLYLKDPRYKDLRESIINKMGKSDEIDMFELSDPEYEAYMKEAMKGRDNKAILNTNFSQVQMARLNRERENRKLEKSINEGRELNSDDVNSLRSVLKDNNASDRDKEIASKKLKIIDAYGLNNYNAANAGLSGQGSVAGGVDKIYKLMLMGVPVYNLGGKRSMPKQLADLRNAFKDNAEISVKQKEYDTAADEEYNNRTAEQMREIQQNMWNQNRAKSVMSDSLISMILPGKGKGAEKLNTGINAGLDAMQGAMGMLFGTGATGGSGIMGGELSYKALLMNQYQANIDSLNDHIRNAAKKRGNNRKNKGKTGQINDAYMKALIKAKNTLIEKLKNLDKAGSESIVEESKWYQSFVKKTSDLMSKYVVDVNREGSVHTDFTGLKNNDTSNENKVNPIDDTLNKVTTKGKIIINQADIQAELTNLGIQGMTNKEAIEYLRKKGYSKKSINKALETRANVKSAIKDAPGAVKAKGAEVLEDAKSLGSAAKNKASDFVTDKATQAKESMALVQYIELRKAGNGKLKSRQIAFQAKNIKFSGDLKKQVQAFEKGEPSTEEKVADAKTKIDDTFNAAENKIMSTFTSVAGAAGEHLEQAKAVIKEQYDKNPKIKKAVNNMEKQWKGTKRGAKERFKYIKDQTKGKLGGVLDNTKNLSEVMQTGNVKQVLGALFGLGKAGFGLAKTAVKSTVRTATDDFKYGNYVDLGNNTFGLGNRRKNKRRGTIAGSIAGGALGMLAGNPLLGAAAGGALGRFIGGRFGKKYPRLRGALLEMGHADAPTMKPKDLYALAISVRGHRGNVLRDSDEFKALEKEAYKPNLIERAGDIVKATGRKFRGGWRIMRMMAHLTLPYKSLIETLDQVLNNDKNPGEKIDVYGMDKYMLYSTITSLSERTKEEKKVKGVLMQSKPFQKLSKVVNSGQGWLVTTVKDKITDLKKKVIRIKSFKYRYLIDFLKHEGYDGHDENHQDAELIKDPSELYLLLDSWGSKKKNQKRYAILKRSRAFMNLEKAVVKKGNMDLFDTDEKKAKLKNIKDDIFGGGIKTRKKYAMLINVLNSNGLKDGEHFNEKEPDSIYNAFLTILFERWEKQGKLDKINSIRRSKEWKKLSSAMGKDTGASRDKPKNIGIFGRMKNGLKNFGRQLGFGKPDMEHATNEVTKDKAKRKEEARQLRRRRWYAFLHGKEAADEVYGTTNDIVDYHPEAEKNIFGKGLDKFKGLFAKGKTKVTGWFGKAKDKGVEAKTNLAEKANTLKDEIKENGLGNTIKDKIVGGAQKGSDVISAATKAGKTKVKQMKDQAKNASMADVGKKVLQKTKNVNTALLATITAGITSLNKGIGSMSYFLGMNDKGEVDEKRKESLVGQLHDDLENVKGGDDSGGGGNFFLNILKRFGPKVLTKLGGWKGLLKFGAAAAGTALTVGGVVKRAKKTKKIAEEQGKAAALGYATGLDTDNENQSDWVQIERAGNAKTIAKQAAMGGMGKMLKTAFGGGKNIVKAAGESITEEVAARTAKNAAKKGLKDVAKTGIKNMAKDAITSIPKMIADTIKKFLNSPKVIAKVGKGAISTLKSLPETIAKKFTTFLKGGVGGAVKSAGKSAKQAFKAVPMAGWIAAIADAVLAIGSGINDAGKYFNVAPKDVTAGMRTAAGVTNGLFSIIQSLLSITGVGAAIAVGLEVIIPKDWLVQTIYKLCANKQAQEELKLKQQEAKDRAAALGTDAEKLTNAENMSLWGKMTTGIHAAFSKKTYSELKDEKIAKQLGLSSGAEYRQKNAEYYEAKSGSFKEKYPLFATLNSPQAAQKAFNDPNKYKQAEAEALQMFKSGDMEAIYTVYKNIHDKKLKYQDRDTNNLNPGFKSKVSKMLDILKGNDIELSINEAKRDPFTQFAYFSKGRASNDIADQVLSLAGFGGLKFWGGDNSINTKTLNSNHLDGGAVDFNINKLDENQFHTVVDTAKKVGIEPGATWGAKDGYDGWDKPHFQNPKTQANTDDNATQLAAGGGIVGKLIGFGKKKSVGRISSGVLNDPSKLAQLAATGTPSSIINAAVAKTKKNFLENYGDKINMRLNEGEMVLNKGQQLGLWNKLKEFERTKGVQAKGSNTLNSLTHEEDTLKLIDQVFEIQNKIYNEQTRHNKVAEDFFSAILNAVMSLAAMGKSKGGYKEDISKMSQDLIDGALANASGM